MRGIHPPQRQRRCCGGRVVKAFRRPPAVRLRDRNGGFPRLSDGVAHGFRCPASPRHALLAENLGKPFLWVIINAPWYKALVKCHGPTEPDPRSWRRGFSFAFARVLIPPMDPDLENVIRQALADARAAGKDYLSQTEEASRPFCRPAPT